MASATQPISPGGFPPGVPTVGLNVVTGQYVRLSDEIKRKMLEAAADGLNELANRIADDSLVEVPKEDNELAASARFPRNDPESRATAEHLEAEISYNTIYADVQHEGVAVMVHHHPIIPGREGFFEKEGASAEIVIDWRAEHYTTPGTKSHFLSDPFKSHIPQMEALIAAKVRERLGPLPITFE